VSSQNDGRRVFVMFCEARADWDTASALADRICREEGPTWLANQDLEQLRCWRSLVPGSNFIAWCKVGKLAKERGFRPPRGGWGGGHDKAAGRKALLLVRQLAKERDLRIDAVFLIRDADGEPRRQGLQQARKLASLVGAAVVIGVAESRRESWVLNGFVPQCPDETDRLKGERQRLGFDPCETPERLTAKHDRPQDKLNSKRVLRHLTNDDPERNRTCWTTTSMDILRKRGTGSGLVQYLDEVRKHVVRGTFCDQGNLPDSPET